MFGIILSVALLLSAADQPPADAAATQPQPQAEEPKLVCKTEFAVGSRVKKVKVCRPVNQEADFQDTKLQREMAKNGDQRVAQGGLMISPGSGIGN